MFVFRYIVIVDLVVVKKLGIAGMGSSICMDEKCGFVKEMYFRMGRMISCRVGMRCEFTWYLGICFVVLSVLVMLVGFGKVCVIFLTCLGAQRGYELIVRVFVV